LNATTMCNAKRQSPVPVRSVSRFAASSDTASQAVYFYLNGLVNCQTGFTLPG
jgi:hypothetical protein